MVCEVFPIRKNLIRNIVTDPSKQSLVTVNKFARLKLASYGLDGAQQVAAPFVTVNTTLDLTFKCMWECFDQYTSPVMTITHSEQLLPSSKPSFTPFQYG